MSIWSDLLERSIEVFYIKLIVTSICLGKFKFIIPIEDMPKKKWHLVVKNGNTVKASLSFEKKSRILISDKFSEKYPNFMRSGRVAKIFKKVYKLYKIWMSC